MPYQLLLSFIIYYHAIFVELNMHKLATFIIVHTFDNAIRNASKTNKVIKVYYATAYTITMLSTETLIMRDLDVIGPNGCQDFMNPNLFLTRS